MTSPPTNPPTNPITPSPSDPPSSFVSRGGIKLQAALTAFNLSPQNLVCADLGCSTGGFSDCLLQNHASHIYSLDTAYGQFAWKLRQHPQITLIERTNALHFNPHSSTLLPQPFPGCDLVVIDLGWTRQALALPAALRWLKKTPTNPPAFPPQIISLLKPQYEAPPALIRGKRTGILPDDQLPIILDHVFSQLPALGLQLLAHIPSPIRGSAAGGKPGNQEFLLLLQPL